ncbi:MAG: tryptophan 2,3-dioxygenase [Gemmatimonadales bacterium]|nr:MAG: tryptophan 2,3-dioxygenase [Gemmatimonadales bacterium]
MMALTYAEYLQLTELLDLQRPRSDPPEHDEMLFIVIHQVYEIWFKLVLHETDKLGDDLRSGELFVAIATLKRIRTIVKTLVAQLDILETMTPLSFASFRERLETASGFQSSQFREVEFAFGYKRSSLVAEGSPVSDRRALQARLVAPSVMDHLYRFLANRGVIVPPDLLSRDVSQPTEASPDLQEQILRTYHEQPELVLLFELLLDLDEGFQEWRYRHVKLVERTIGAKHGTGGSAGVEFLKRSLFTPLFPDLWAVRHQM